MSAIAYLWTIELENNGTGLFREKNESPCYASLGISKRRAWALPRSTRGTRVPNCSIRWGLATMSQSSCLTAPRAKSMHSRCIAPVSARTRVRADTGVGHFPNVAKIGEYAKHFRIDFRFAVGSCSIAHSPGALPYSSRSNKLFMSVSFMGAPAEGSFSARNFST